MGPRPYSERSSLPNESTTNDISAELVPMQVVAESPSPPTLSNSPTAPSPIPQTVIPVENANDYIAIQEEGTVVDPTAIPCYPAPGDTMPYDHALPDFIRQLTNQPNLANLHSLSLRVISRLISLQRMSMYTPNLRELDLEGSMLGSLRDIGCNLKYLQVLKVGKCQLDSLDGTFGLTSLRELYAQKNFITDVSPCSNLPHIRHINISHNRIRNISYAGFLSICSKLRSIVFTGNPATDVAGYREHVRRILPQVESLDEVPFLNEDNYEDSRESELIENCGEKSDSSSIDVADYTPISPSDSMSNLYEPDDDGFFLEKSCKHARNVANQEQFEAVDYEVQEVLSGKTGIYDLEDDFYLLDLKNAEGKNLVLEETREIDVKNLNLKQRCTSIQKIDKDIENQSKKSNHSLKDDFDEGFFSLPELKIKDEKVKKATGFVNHEFLPSSHLFTYDEAASPFSTLQSDTSSTDILCQESTQTTSLEQSGNSRRCTNKDKRPSTASGEHNTQTSYEAVAGSSKFGVIKKRPATAAPKLETRDSGAQEDEKKSVIESGASKLTSGAPVCGNLTAALRNRKKHQTAWEDKNISKTRKSEPLILVPKGKDAIEVQLDAAGDNFDSNSCIKRDDQLIGEDVLTSSKKWREAFRRFRSNNRARWEEEDKMDYSSLLGDIDGPYDDRYDDNGVQSTEN